MKTYFYSTSRELKHNWDDAPQYSVDFDNWPEFIFFCTKLAESQNTEIRACETSGYNNQGYYITG